MPPIKKAAAKKAPAKKAPAKRTPAEVKPSQRAYNDFDEKFTKRFGGDAIHKPSKRAYRVVSTGSLTVDRAMGCGGYPVGRIIEIWGPESVGKTTFALIAIGNFQREFPDKRACFIDIERTFDAAWAEVNGVDLSRLRIMKPRTSEDVSEMARMAVESRIFSVIVLDSVGGMITEEELTDIEASKASVGTQAKVVTRMVKQQAVFCEETNTTLIIINQVRAKIGGYGADTDTGGGWALKHVTTHKLRMRRTGTEPYTVGTGENKEQVGVELALICEKNKVAPPRRIGVFGLFNQETAEYGPVGIDRAGEAFAIGKRLAIIAEPSQGYFLLPGIEEKIHGQAKVVQMLREDPELLDKVRREVLARVADQVAAEIPDEDPHTDQPVAENGVLEFSSGAPDDFVDFKLLDQLREDARTEVVAAAT